MTENPTELGARLLARAAEIEKELEQIEDDLDKKARAGGRMPVGLYSRRDRLWDEQDALQSLISPEQP